MWKPRKAISRSGVYFLTKEKTIGKIYLFIKKTIKITSYNATVTHNRGSPYEASESRFFTISVCISGCAS